MIDLIGVYSVDGQKDVHLIELSVRAKYSDINIGEFTQKQDGVDRLSWQTPWDEKYLNDEGTIIIGDWINTPKDFTDITRIAFFLHFLDIGKPLATPFGDIKLKRPEAMPNRLTLIIKYERPD